MQGNQTKNGARPPHAVQNYIVDKACLSYQRWTMFSHRPMSTRNPWQPLLNLLNNILWKNTLLQTDIVHTGTQATRSYTVTVKGCYDYYNNTVLYSSNPHTCGHTIMRGFTLPCGDVNPSATPINSKIHLLHARVATMGNLHGRQFA